MLEGDAAREFQRILSRLADDYTYDETIRYLKGLGREDILKFESHVVLAGPQVSIYVAETQGVILCREINGFVAHSFVTHSATRPAAGEDYYMFNLYFTQREWFTILGYGEEEQLAHILKWGRH